MKNVIPIILLTALCLNCIEKPKEESNKKMSEKLVLDSKEQKKPITKDENISLLREIDTTFILDKNRSIEQYKENLNKLYELISNEVKIEPMYVESIIARSQEEFSEFYSLSYTNDNKKLSLYDKTNELIVEMAQEDKGNCFIPYFGLAEFVDGEYAESFFDDAFYVAENKPEKFCRIYDELSLKSKERLLDIYNKFCKGFKNPR